MAYIHAPFTITLTDPNRTLFVQAGPVPAYLDNIKIEVTELSWAVTPDWNASLAKTLKVSPSAPADSGSCALPVPPGPAKTVTVSGKASTPGGYLNGFTIPAQSFAIGSDTKKVGFMARTSV